MTGELVGTLRYMSPEQALAKRVVVDHRTDIYSLGVTLYELLTLRPPFGGDDRQELLRQIAFEEPRRLRWLNKTIPAELEIIVLKALEKNPADRYATAQELAADLRRFLDDQPIQARRPTLVQRARKWGRRHQAVVWSAAVIALILAASLGWITRDWRARRMDAEGRVVEALAIAEAKLREGNPYDPQLVSAARTAEAQLTSGVVRAELQQQVKQVLVDWAMLIRLDEIRLDQAAANPDGFDFAGADAAYTEAFREYGIDVQGRGGLEAAAQIRQRAIGLHLAVALDNWAYARQRAQGEGWKRLLEVAQEADPDPWRCALREARAKESREELEKLAASAPIPELSPTTLSVFGLALQRAGAVVLAEKVLREGQLLHPDDFWITSCLADLLSKDAKSRDAKSPQLEETIGFYRAALALRPRSAVIHTNLGHLHERNGELDEAVASCREAIRLNKDYALAHTNLGVALWRQGKLDEAAACFREAIRLKKDDAMAHSNLGCVLTDQGKLDEAVASCREAIRLDKNYATAHVNLGSVLVRQGKLDEAVASFGEAIRLKKDDADAHNSLGAALQNQGKLDEAIACCREAVRLKKDDADAHNSLGFVLWRQGKLAAAASFREAIRLKKDYALAHCNLGCVLEGLGKLDEAVACSREAIRLNKNLAAAHCNLAVALESQGKLDEAIASFREAIHLDKNLAMAHFHLGSALGRQGKLDEAVACFREAIRLNKDDAPAHCNLGVALMSQGKLDEAVACFREAVRLDKNFALAYENLGSALEKLGRYADALKLHEETLALRKAKLGPDHTDTLASMQGLANSYAELGRHADALKLREETLTLQKAKLGPDHPETLGSMNNLANSYFDLGRYAEALKVNDELLALQKAKLGSDHIDTLASMVNLANSYGALGQSANAIKYFQTALAVMKIKMPDHPFTFNCMNGLAHCYHDLGRYVEAIKLHEETLALRKAKLGPDHPDTLRSMGLVAESLMELNRGAEALGIIDDGLKQVGGRMNDPGLIALVLQLRLLKFAQLKDAAGCRATAEWWDQLKRTDNGSLYDAACAHAVAASVLRATEKSAAGAKQANAEAGQAMGWLKQAVAAGYKNVAHMKQDKDLADLRQRQDFQALIAQLEAKPPVQAAVSPQPPARTGPNGQTSQKGKQP
jgi:tetratricopeptide (TPR) repeat protein